MADLALTYTDGIIDLDLGDDGSAIDEGLYTAVIISLFSDRRAEADDDLSDASGDRRGWWGDIYPDSDGDLIGSRLWLLSREKQIHSVVQRAEQYAAQALQWLIDDGIADRVEVTGSNLADGVLALVIQIYRPDGDIVDYRFDNLWEALNGV